MLIQIGMVGTEEYLSWTDKDSTVHMMGLCDYLIWGENGAEAFFQKIFFIRCGVNAG